VYLKSVDLHNFRNVLTGQFICQNGINIIYGPNASGKTNLLEAFHLLSNLRSFRARTFREMLHWDHVEGCVRGIVESAPINGELFTKTFTIALQSDTRTAYVNAKQYPSSRDYLRILPSVTFIPDDLSLVKGAPADRRVFLDRGTFHYYTPYWNILTEYHHALRQKNTLLRQLQTSVKKTTWEQELNIWDTQLQTVGSKIIAQRLLFLNALQPTLDNIYTQWLQSTERIDLVYECNLGLTGLIPELTAQFSSDFSRLLDIITTAYSQAIIRQRPRELRFGATQIGPHRDDLKLNLTGKLLQAYGSQGQQRTAVLALKLAEAELYFQRHQEYPLVILDDVTSELDHQRNQKLFEFLQQGMQVFISTTEMFNFKVGKTCHYIQLPLTSNKFLSQSQGISSK